MFQTTRAFIKQSTWLQRWGVLSATSGAIVAGVESTDEWLSTKRNDYAKFGLDVTAAACWGSIGGVIVGVGGLCFAPVVVPCMAYGLYRRSKEKKDM
jgi:hypothetical protein